MSTEGTMVGVKAQNRAVWGQSVNVGRDPAVQFDEEGNGEATLAQAAILSCVGGEYSVKGRANQKLVADYMDEQGMEAPAAAPQEPQQPADGTGDDTDEDEDEAVENDDDADGDEAPTSDADGASDETPVADAAPADEEVAPEGLVTPDAIIKAFGGDAADQTADQKSATGAEVFEPVTAIEDVEYLNSGAKKALTDAGITTAEGMYATSDADLIAIDGIAEKTVAKIAQNRPKK